MPLPAILRALQHIASSALPFTDREGFILDAPPLADAICHDPILKPLKLIAAPSDESLLPRSGARGFPHWGLWQQRNAGFGRDLMAFLAEGGLWLVVQAPVVVVSHPGGPGCNGRLGMEVHEAGQERRAGHPRACFGCCLCVECTRSATPTLTQTRQGC